MRTTTVVSFASQLLQQWIPTVTSFYSGHKTIRKKSVVSASNDGTHKYKHHHSNVHYLPLGLVYNYQIQYMTASRDQKSRNIHYCTAGWQGG